MANTVRMRTTISPGQWQPWTAVSPNKGETAVYGCHCPGDMVVRMRMVLAIPRGWYVCLSADKCCLQLIYPWVFQIISYCRFGNVKMYRGRSGYELKRMVMSTSRALVRATPRRNSQRSAQY